MRCVPTLRPTPSSAVVSGCRLPSVPAAVATPAAAPSITAIACPNPAARATWSTSNVTAIASATATITSASGLHAAALTAISSSSAGVPSRTAALASLTASASARPSRPGWRGDPLARTPPQRPTGQEGRQPRSPPASRIGGRVRRVGHGQTEITQPLLPGHHFSHRVGPAPVFPVSGADGNARVADVSEHGGGKNDLAEDRTDLAEDRTLLANERTFSGWARTALASIGIGIGFNALFKPVEPTWVAKAIATLFLLLAAFLAARRRAPGARGTGAARPRIN